MHTVYRLPDMELIRKLAVTDGENTFFINDVAISDDLKWLVAVGTRSRPMDVRTAPLLSHGCASCRR
jgi:hypothetical protein